MISLQYLSSKSDYDKYSSDETVVQNWKLGQFISEKTKNVDITYIYGYCESCDQPQKMIIDWKYSNGEQINFRERLVCSGCNLNNRQRFMIGYIKRLYKPNDTIYMYEQVTSLFHRSKQLFPNLIGSEYLGFDLKPGKMVGKIRHEDALNLSFNDSSFDIIVSNDVYEHVPDIELCFREAYRTLKTGGDLVFTIPFYHTKEKTERRCELRGKEVFHFKKPEYHGNPTGGEDNSLVFYDYGWDVLEICKEAGFSRCHVVPYFGYFYGYLDNQILFHAIK